MDNTMSPQPIKTNTTPEARDALQKVADRMGWSLTHALEVAAALAATASDAALLKADRAARRAVKRRDSA
jgi:hypothetical protein